MGLGPTSVCFVGKVEEALVGKASIKLKPSKGLGAHSISGFRCELYALVMSIKETR